MAKQPPSIGIGTIFQRRRAGPFYFELKSEGIRVSLETNDPVLAKQEARRRFGHLLAADRVEQLQELRARLEVAEQEEVAARRESIRLEKAVVWTAYERQLALVSKVVRHADGTRAIPLSGAHLNQQRCSLSVFLRWYNAHGRGLAMHQVTAAEAQAFFMHYLDTGVKPSTFNRRLSDLSIIWARLSKQIASENPFSSVPPRKKGEVALDTAHRQLFSAEELAIIRERATGWIAVGVTIAQETGLRLGDVVTLQTSEVQHDGYIVRQARKSNKKQVLHAPLSVSAVAAWLQETPPQEGYVFYEKARHYLGLGGLKPDQTDAVREFQTFLRETCQIETKSPDGQTVKGFHSLRALAATRAAAQGIGNAQRLLGHTDGRTTEGYVQLTLAEAKARARASSVTPLEHTKDLVRQLSPDDRAALLEWLACESDDPASPE